MSFYREDTNMHEVAIAGNIPPNIRGNAIRKSIKELLNDKDEMECLESLGFTIKEKLVNYNILKTILPKSSHGNTSYHIEVLLESGRKLELIVWMEPVIIKSRPRINRYFSGGARYDYWKHKNLETR